MWKDQRHQQADCCDAEFAGAAFPAAPACHASQPLTSLHHEHVHVNTHTYNELHEPPALKCAACQELTAQSLSSATLLLLLLLPLLLLLLLLLL